MGSGLIVGLTEHLRLTATNNDNTLTNLHTLEITTAHTKSPRSAIVFTSRC
jgi:hypothetical protein